MVQYDRDANDIFLSQEYLAYGVKSFRYQHPSKYGVKAGDVHSWAMVALELISGGEAYRHFSSCFVHSRDAISPS